MFQDIGNGIALTKLSKVPLVGESHHNEADVALRCFVHYCWAHFTRLEDLRIDRILQLLCEPFSSVKNLLPFGNLSGQLYI